MIKRDSFLIVQTAFTGDAILASSLVEKLHSAFPGAAIDILVRKGNEGLFLDHPFLHEVLTWDKRQNKYGHLLSTIQEIRRRKYFAVINVQRFASTGLLTAFANTQRKIGFSKNPFSFLFTTKVPHAIGNGMHEIDRNQLLIAGLTDSNSMPPRLYPRPADFEAVSNLKTQPFITIAPASVWFTKTFPPGKWMELIGRYQKERPGVKVYLLGSKDEAGFADNILQGSNSDNIENLCGKLTLLESAALMKDADMNYSNDSAPMHLASSVNAPVTAIYCSTVPRFGFGPLSEKSFVIETKEHLTCRPCGLHGFAKCPQAHFKCAHTINVSDIPIP